MRPFRFRAQAALDFRRRQYDKALLQQASARRALDAADQAFEEAGRVIRAAELQLGDAMRAPLAHSQIEWHRAWRGRCAGDQARWERQRDEHRLDVQRKTELVMTAYRRVRSLERLRDLAIVAWNRASQQEERKTMDALAASRIVQRKEDRDEFHFGN